MSTQTIEIWRGAEGNIINIGPWDYVLVAINKTDVVATNPVPEGAYQEFAEVEVLPNGARAVVE